MTRLLTNLAAWLLPSWSRDRYAAEFHADLAELTWWRRCGYAITVLALALPLRIAVLRAAAVRHGFERPPLHCLLGFGHRFHSVSTDDGSRYRQCRRCGLDDPHLGRGQTDWATGLQLGSMSSWS
jgi:hypothetical protein